MLLHVGHATRESKAAGTLSKLFAGADGGIGYNGGGVAVAAPHHPVVNSFARVTNIISMELFPRPPYSIDMNQRNCFSLSDPPAPIHTQTYTICAQGARTTEGGPGGTGAPNDVLCATCKTNCQTTACNDACDKEFNWGYPVECEHCQTYFSPTCEPAGQQVVLATDSSNSQIPAGCPTCKCEAIAEKTTLAPKTDAPTKTDTPTKTDEPTEQPAPPVGCEELIRMEKKGVRFAMSRWTLLLLVLCCKPAAPLSVPNRVSYRRSPPPHPVTRIVFRACA